MHIPLIDRHSTKPKRNVHTEGHGYNFVKENLLVDMGLR